MSVVDEALDISYALGNGVYAIGKDIFLVFSEQGKDMVLVPMGALRRSVTRIAR